MALVNCAECGASISDQAVMCPQCGLPRQGMQEVIKAARQCYWSYDWKSKTTVHGWPLVHIAFGRSRETGKLLVARGIIAIGQFAVGVVTIAQFGLGLLFGFGQFVTGVLAIGQFSAGIAVVGQFALGLIVLAQVGIGQFVWAINRRDPAAEAFFTAVWRFLGGR